MHNLISYFRASLLALAVISTGPGPARAQTPVITAQPQSINAVLGAPATFSVSANNALAYQWRKESALIPGATTTALTLASVRYGDAGIYSVLVSNTNGTVASGNATLTVTQQSGSGVDFTFNPGSGANGAVRAVAQQLDGKVLLGGGFTTINAVSRIRIARLNADGSLDTSFQAGLSGADNTVRAVAVQPDGKVLVGGGFQTVNGTSRAFIARLNADGSLDTSFSPPSGLTGAGVYALAVRAGEVLIGGAFGITGVTRNSIAQLNADGSLDTIFQNGLTGAGIYGTVSSLAVQTDGKVVVGGTFTTFNSAARNRIARLNAWDGSLDTTFQNGMAGADNEVHSVAVQPDGKVLIGGYFTNVNGTARTCLARLNAGDGSLDTAFNPSSPVFPPYPDSYVESIAVQFDGTVLIGGFSDLGWLGHGAFGVISSDGSGFAPPWYHNDNGPIYSIAVQTDGNLLIGGDFTTLSGGVSRNRIARLQRGLGSSGYDAVDADGDGLSNAWERQHGLNPELPNRQMGTGSAGPLSVGQGDYYTDGVWARVLGMNNAGLNTLNVSTTNGFAVSNLVLMITMQDPNLNLTQNTAGTYEFGRIAALGNNTFTLAAARSNAFTVTTSEKIQVLKVPEYTDVTLTDSALQLDGTSQYVRIADNPALDLTTNYTLECWFKADSFVAGEYHGLISKYQTNGGFILRFDSSELDLDGVYTTGLNPQPGRWYHVAGVCSNNTRTIYLDGVPQRTGVAGAAPASTDPVCLGVDYLHNYNRFFDGQMDEVRIWNVPRSQSDITNNMRRALSGEEPGLVAYYRFKEGTGSVAHDSTPNHFDGALTSGPSWVPSGSLTCQPWNGTNGGVLAFLARNLTLASNCVISADAKGYRGGSGVPPLSYGFGIAGERTTGVSVDRESNSLERPQGGGGASGAAGSSGGGGGYGSSGQPGLWGGYDDKLRSTAGSGAAAFGTNTLARLYPGGGGGGSGSHDSGRIGVGGGAGGGVVFVAAGSIQGSGTISSRGAPGQRGIYVYHPCSGSGGGGGAGGTIYLLGNVASSLQVLADGGAGGLRDDPSSYDGANGGAGGFGRIRLDLPASGPALTNVSPAPGYLAQLSASNPTTTWFWSDYLDSDNDGLSDVQELAQGTNPMNPDTDGDGIPDGWEVSHGLNPTNASDAWTLAPGIQEQLTWLQKFRYGLNPLTNDTDGDGLTDYQELFIYHTDPNAASIDPYGLSAGHRYYYDTLDRLVGVDYTNGLSLLYSYDGNNNLRRQALLARDANLNGLPDTWEQLHGLTKGLFVDTDGDGYTDLQEYLAGTDPCNPHSFPGDPLGPAGSNLITGGIVFPFTPSNCVVAAGQLDAIGGEEIVVSADGNPGTNHNFLLILSQTPTGWTTQGVDVGQVGITSLAVGQPANRDVQAIYAGLRQAGGTGSIIEVTRAGTQWSVTTITNSTGSAAFVLGVRPGRDVIVSLARPNASSGTPYYLSFSANGWTLTKASTNTSQRGLGTVTQPGLTGLMSRGVRLLDAGGLQVLGDEGLVPTNANWSSTLSSSWLFLTTNSTTWEACQAYAQLYGGNLVTVTNSFINSVLWGWFPGDYWIGLQRENFDCAAPWRWASGLPILYTNFAAGQPNGCASGESVVSLYQGAGWHDWLRTVTKFGICEVRGLAGPSISSAEPALFSQLPWRGSSLCAGDLRLNGSLSILSATVVDRNQDSTVSAGDEFRLTEYLFDGVSLVTNDLERVTLAGATLAPSYGLVCVDVLSGNQQALFTAEPDGLIYSWSATNGATALQRQLFSAHDPGKAWHALAAVRTLDSGQSLLGLRVDPATPNRCDVVLWPSITQLSGLPTYPQTAPITQILPLPNTGTNLAPVSILLWDAEGDPAQVTLQYQRAYETTWWPATIDLTGWLSAPPTGATNSITWFAAADLGEGYTNTVQLRARAQDISLVGEWSAAMPYQVYTAVGNHPQANPDFASTVPGQFVDIPVLANDTIANSAPMFIRYISTPQSGTAVTNLNQTIRYTPAPGFLGNDQFNYIVTDGAAYSEATVTVTVLSVPIVLTLPAVYTAANTNWFGFLVTGPAGTYQVLASTNVSISLTGWSVAGVVTNTGGGGQFSEALLTNAPARFYRAVLMK